EGSAELVQLKHRVAGAVEKVPRVHVVVADILEQSSVEAVRSRLRHHGNLSSGAGSVFRRVVAAFDAKLLNILEARLQTKLRRALSVQVTGRLIDHAAAGHAVEFNDVLLVRSPAEADIVERSAARRLSTRRQQIELRDL